MNNVFEFNGISLQIVNNMQNKLHFANIPLRLLKPVH